MNEIQILSLNLWNVNPPLEKRMDRLCNFLQKCRPDVVALQEVSPVDGTPQSAIIQRRTGYATQHYSQAGEWYGREEGLAVLTTEESTVEKVVDLPLGDEEIERIMQVGRIETREDRPLFVANTHLAYQPDATDVRTKQTRTIRNHLTCLSEEHPKAPIVLCGDFNDTPDSQPVKTLLQADHVSFVDSWADAGCGEGVTFSKNNTWADPGLNPGRRIDHIFASGVCIDSCELLFTSDDEWGRVSDHYGVLAQINTES